MLRIRNLNRSLDRCPTRHTTRMLGGARRPPPLNYLALACRALKEVIRIDERLLPYMAEHRQELDRWLLDQDIQAALRKVYGDDALDAIPPQPPHPVSVPEAALLLKQELALAKSRLVLDTLKSKLGLETVKKR